MDRFSLSSSENNKIKQMIKNRLYSFPTSSTWHDVFDEISKPGEIGLRKTESVLATVSNTAIVQF